MTRVHSAAPGAQAPATTPPGPPAAPSTVQTVNIRREVEIAAPVETVFAAVLEENGPGGTQYDGKPFPRVLEAWPGGRWFRDLGQAGGHLWGHVQVIKPPTLLELTGPMFMSYPGLNFIQYRLTPSGPGTKLTFVHQAMGLIPAEHATGVVKGWEFIIKRIGERAAGKSLTTKGE
jgi:uncharacterized protein YndB with AHSA1/START domain